MSLADRLNRPQIDQPIRGRSKHPTGWEPGIKFDANDVRFITTDLLPQLEGEPDFAAALADMGIQIPDGYRVRIAEMRFDPVAWTRETPDQKYATTRPAWRYRFVVEPDSTSTPQIDGVAVLNSLKRAPKTRLKATGSGTFVTNINDTQIGKDAGGGTAATIERLDAYFDMAVDRARQLKNEAGDMVLLLGGDLVEGCFIYPNQSFQIDRDRREQIRTTTAVLLNYLDRMAPIFPRIRVLAVGGNHGEHRVNGKRINRHDNDDQLAAEAAAMATERDHNLSHVAWTIATDQPALTMDIQGHILGLTHGSVFGKSTGSTPAVKAYNWYKNMAAGRQPVGDADILVTAHFHHEQVVNFGQLLWTQLPAMDGGSPEFTEYSGTSAEPGMATWLMTPESRFTRYEVLRETK